MNEPGFAKKKNSLFEKSQLIITISWQVSENVSKHEGGKLVGLRYK